MDLIKFSKKIFEPALEKFTFRKKKVTGLNIDLFRGNLMKERKNLKLLDKTYLPLKLKKIQVSFSE